MLCGCAMGIVTPVSGTLVTTITKGFTGYEAAIPLRKTNQQSLDRVYMRLGSCKRIFKYG